MIISSVEYSSLFQYIIRYRFIGHILFSLSIYLDFLYKDRSITGIYILYMLFVGIVLSNKWLLIFISGTAVSLRYYFSPLGFPGSELFLFQWFTYFAIAFILTNLINKNLDNEKNKIELIKVLVQSLDSRDKYTAYHSQNVAKYARLIAKEIKLSNRICENIYLGALLHDIGKIGIPEDILNKPDKLTDEEYELIKKHPLIGYEIVKYVSLFKKNGISDMVLYHHERFDGFGYPHGLKGEQIPLAARIISVADSFDAMISPRLYKKGNNMEFAVQELKKNKGLQFDPDIADAFIHLLETETAARTENFKLSSFDKMQSKS